MRQVGNSLHLVPVRTRLVNGEWHDTHSVLDARITVPPAPRLIDDQIEAILAAVRSTLRVDIRRLDVMIKLPYHSGAERVWTVQGISAREALVAALAEAPRPFGWSIGYSPLFRTWTLGLRTLSFTPEEMGLVERPPLPPPPRMPGPGPAAAPPTAGR